MLWLVMDQGGENCCQHFSRPRNPLLLLLLLLVTMQPQDLGSGSPTFESGHATHCSYSCCLLQCNHLVEDRGSGIRDQGSGPRIMIEDQASRIEDLVRLIFSTSLYFESICFLLPKLAKVKVKVALLRPKAPEQSVALWSPRHQHHLHPALD